MAQLAGQQEEPVAQSVPPGSAFRPAVVSTAPTVPESERALPSKPPGDGRFTFTADDGQTFTSTKAVTAVVTPGLLRRHRGDEVEFAFRALELLFEDNPAAMSAIDGSWATLGQVTRGLQPFVEDAIRLGLGE